MNFNRIHVAGYMSAARRRSQDYELLRSINEMVTIEQQSDDMISDHLPSYKAKNKALMQMLLSKLEDSVSAQKQLTTSLKLKSDEVECLKRELEHFKGLVGSRDQKFEQEMKQARVERQKLQQQQRECERFLRKIGDRLEELNINFREVEDSDEDYEDWHESLDAFDDATAPGYSVGDEDDLSTRKSLDSITSGMQDLLAAADRVDNDTVVQMAVDRRKTISTMGGIQKQGQKGSRNQHKRRSSIFRASSSFKRRMTLKGFGGSRRRSLASFGSMDDENSHVENRQSLESNLDDYSLDGTNHVSSRKSKSKSYCPRKLRSSTNSAADAEQAWCGDEMGIAAM